MSHQLPPTYHSPLFIFYLPLCLFGWPSLSSHLFSFFFSQTLPHTLPLIPPCHHLHRHFSGNVTRKSIGTSKHLNLLFEVKFLILLVSFIFCLRLYFYLNFNNDTHVIYEHWKWHLCIYMYGFCICGIIWWVGLWFVLMMTI